MSRQRSRGRGRSRGFTLNPEPVRRPGTTIDDDGRPTESQNRGRGAESYNWRQRDTTNREPTSEDRNRDYRYQNRELQNRGRGAESYNCRQRDTTNRGPTAQRGDYRYESGDGEYSADTRDHRYRPSENREHPAISRDDRYEQMGNRPADSRDYRYRQRENREHPAGSRDDRYGQMGNRSVDSRDHRYRPSENPPEHPADDKYRLSGNRQHLPSSRDDEYRQRSHQRESGEHPADSRILEHRSSDGSQDNKYPPLNENRRYPQDPDKGGKKDTGDPDTPDGASGGATTYPKEEASGSKQASDVRNKKKKYNAFQEIVTKSKELTSKQGSSGVPIQLITNHFRLITRAEGVIYQYHVTFNPPIAGKNLCTGLMREHAKKMFKVYAFDGMILFAPEKLPQDTTEVFSKLHTDGSTVRITIKLTSEFLSRDPMTMQLYNLILRRTLGMLDMKQIGLNGFRIQTQRRC